MLSRSTARSIRNGGIFGFDGDGIAASTLQCAGTNAQDTSTGTMADRTPSLPTSRVSAPICNDGVVNFIGGLANGSATGIFSLENPLTSASFTVTVGGVPLPSTWTMMLGGFAVFGYLAFRGKKKASAAIATA